jgi:hypothetical protein
VLWQVWWHLDNCKDPNPQKLERQIQICTLGGGKRIEVFHQLLVPIFLVASQSWRTLELVICKVRKTQHQNPVRLKKHPAKKYISMQGGG